MPPEAGFSPAAAATSVPISTLARTVHRPFVVRFIDYLPENQPAC
jgi:hypothetical protein